MNLNRISRGSVTKKLLINHSTILHIIPDFNTDLTDHIEKLENIINIHNAFALIVKTGIFKIRSKTLNPRQYYLKVKRELQKSPISKILRSTPKIIPDKRFIIFDHSTISKGVEYISELTSPKQGIFYLFQQLKKEFQEIKVKLPAFENVLLFLLNSNGKNSLFEMLSYSKFINIDDLNQNFNSFDKYALVNVDDIILPIIGYNQKGSLEIYRSNFSKISSTLIKLEKEKEKIKEIKSSQKETNTPSKKLENITKDVFKKPEEINQKKLSGILRKFKIKDPTLINNIKYSIDIYLQSTKEKTKQYELEQLILKSVNYSIFGHNKIKDEYLDDPNKLFSKLVDINTYSQELTIIEPKQDQLINPKELINLKRVTGPIRHEYEFNENVHGTIKTLFDSLTKKLEGPIKILKISHKYDDNNLNRFIEYTVKLKNLTGKFKTPYEVKLRLPALINQKYFKLNGYKLAA